MRAAEGGFLLAAVRGEAGDIYPLTGGEDAEQESREDAEEARAPPGAAACSDGGGQNGGGREEQVSVVCVVGLAHANPNPNPKSNPIPNPNPNPNPNPSPNQVGLAHANSIVEQCAERGLLSAAERGGTDTEVARAVRERAAASGIAELGWEAYDRERERLP